MLRVRQKSKASERVVQAVSLVCLGPEAQGSWERLGSGWSRGRGAGLGKSRGREAAGSQGRAEEAGGPDARVLQTAPSPAEGCELGRWP